MRSEDEDEFRRFTAARWAGLVRTDADRGIEERDVLFAALAALPPRQRAVGVLRYWEDLAEGEVAELLGCSVGTVKSQAPPTDAILRRGRSSLRRRNGLAGSGVLGLVADAVIAGTAARRRRALRRRGPPAVDEPGPGPEPEEVEH